MAEVASSDRACVACGRWHGVEESCDTLVREEGGGGHPSRQAPASQVEDADSLVGLRLGSFQLVRRLGRGGMGSVYLGEHVSIGSRVAVKVLHEHLARYPELVQRFHAEARAVNLIGHENIVSIFDLNAEPPRPYLIMEYLDGAPLSAWVGSPLPSSAVVPVLAQVCDALHAAHSRGIVHRDLKPDNVFLVKRGSRGSPFVKVLDFGIAKLMDARMPETHAGIIVGTPEYMAPEQSLGRRLDGRADLYAVGVLAYQLVTGRLPFTEEGLTAQLVAHQTRSPPPPRSVCPAVPPAVEHVILRALAKTPEERYPTALALRAALEQAVSTVTPHPARASPAPGAEATPPRPLVSPIASPPRPLVSPIASPVAPGTGAAPPRPLVSPVTPGAEAPPPRPLVSPVAPGAGATPPRPLVSPATPGAGAPPPLPLVSPVAPGAETTPPRPLASPVVPGAEVSSATPARSRIAPPGSPAAPVSGGAVAPSGQARAPEPVSGGAVAPSGQARASEPVSGGAPATPGRARALELPVQVVLRPGDSPVPLTSSDLSRGGLFLHTGGALPPLFARVQVVLPLESGPLSVACEVVRHVPPDQARAWGMPPGFGVQFVSPSPALRSVVDQLLKGGPVRRPTPPSEAPVDNAEAGRALSAFEERLSGDHYAVLNLPLDADMESARTRAREVWAALESLRHRSLSRPQRARLEAVQARVREAGETLGLPARRALYDARLGNPRGVGRCLEAGLTATQLEALRREHLAGRPHDAGTARVHFLTGSALERDGQLARALESYERGLALDPLDLDLQQRHRVVRRALGARAAAGRQNDEARSPREGTGLQNIRERG